MQNVEFEVLGLGVTQGHQQCHYLIECIYMTAYSTVIETVHLPCTVLEL